MAAVSGIVLLKTPYRAPKANAICERFMGNLQREYLDYMFILNPHHLYKIVKEYVAYYNQVRPHQGIGQRIPEPEAVPAIEPASTGRIISRSILGGLHHDYRRAA